MTDETVLYENGNIKVTSSRFIVNGQTYVVSSFTSIKMLKQNRGIASFFFLITIGVGYFSYKFYSVNGLSDSWPFILATAITFWIGTLFKPYYFVSIVSSSGLFSAVKSTDKDKIVAIIDALNQAIVNNSK
ncbi:MAG: DUF6232 family protein [Epsilonproteobacteria bacterium]|nr:DUF6232 family protein [Campylobacterota bacterium]